MGPDTLDIIAAQLDASMPDGATGATLVIAYEPIWAIGTGRVPTLDQIAETHDMIRARLKSRFGDEGNNIRILYGGSVKPTNAAEIFTAENVDGALVGGASLKASDFQPIIDALAASRSSFISRNKPRGVRPKAEGGSAPLPRPPQARHPISR